MQDLKGKRIAILATDGFKEIEFLDTWTTWPMPPAAA
jgi:hypothetical protein